MQYLLIIILSLANLAYVKYGPVCDYGYYPAVFSTIMLFYLYRSYATTPIIRALLMAGVAYWMTDGDIPRVVTMYVMSLSTNSLIYVR